ncbi:MAG: hypothetical protein KME12_18390 [Trichocoleus desertorum ATA4-8-CV12]|jgi:hypothetical protein|nr:hypothetical protein [Trichocoleus desertorum ATA4-8-CV12]
MSASVLSGNGGWAGSGDGEATLGELELESIALELGKGTENTTKPL